MSDQDPELGEHEEKMIELIAQIMEMMPEKILPYDVTALIVNLIDLFDMHDVWTHIALDATTVLREIEMRNLRERVLN